MPLYELLLIARTVKSSSLLDPILKAKLAHKELLIDTCTQILKNQGVVRSMTNMGERILPGKMKRHQEIFDYGRFCWLTSYFTILFDASPKLLKAINKDLRMNETVIRHTLIKTGESLRRVTAA